MNPKISIDLDALHEELCILKPGLVLFLNDEIKRALPVSDKWCQIALVENSELQNVAQLLLLELCIPVCNVYVERVFSVTNCYWSNESNEIKVNLIKSESVVKMNQKYV